VANSDRDFHPADRTTSRSYTNLAKPDRNGTGVSFLAAELHEKSLEMLHELIPRARRIMYLVNPANPLSPRDRVKMHAAADALGLELITIEAQNIYELRAGTAPSTASPPPRPRFLPTLVFPGIE